MFCLEINFRDGISFSETLLLTRLSNLIGKNSTAHLEIEGAKNNTPDIRVTRSLARGFEVEFLGEEDSAQDRGDKQHLGFAEFDLSSFSLCVTALDSDLLLRQDEAVESAAKRILKSALNYPAPEFPVLIILSEGFSMCSLANQQEYIFGRSRNSTIRVDDQTVSESHAKISLVDKQIWLEDLASRNGTYINGARIDQPVKIDAKDMILFGSKTKVRIVYSESELETLKEEFRTLEKTKATDDNPSVISSSMLVNPQNLAIIGPKILRIGRDPISEIWVGASHVSRLHAEVRYTENLSLEIRDLSTNGCLLNGSRMPKNIWLEVKDGTALDLGGGILLYLCENKSAQTFALKRLQSTRNKLSNLDLLSNNRDLSNLAATSTALASQYGAKNDPGYYRRKTSILDDAELSQNSNRAKKDFLYAVLLMLILASSLILALQLVIFS